MVTFIPPSVRDLLDIATSGDMSEAMEDAGESAAEYARSVAPVVTGEYRDSFRVEQSKGEAHLINDADYAAAVEWGKGSEHASAHHVLSQTADYIEGGA